MSHQQQSEHHHYHQQQQESDTHHNSAFLLDALYCSEEHLEEEGVPRGDSFLEEEEEEVGESYCTGNTYKTNSESVILVEQDLFWENEELISLLSKEDQNEVMHTTLQTDPSLAEARREGVEWMFKVIAHYSFSAPTAVLAVAYLDRFLVSDHFQKEKPWMIQLTAVACLSLAAKMEETQVPLLLDLQVEESKYVFEAKIIKRMELLVLSTLEWKMNPVTPLSFLDYITRRLGLKDHLSLEFLRRCERVTLSVISDSRFLSFLPSVVATATMLHVVNSIEPCLRFEYQNQLLGILGIEKDKVEDCCKLVMELASVNLGNQSNKRKFCSMPGSPNGVMDVSFSSDSSNDSWAVASSVSSSPEPLSKKSRAINQDHATNADFLSIPR